LKKHAKRNEHCGGQRGRGKARARNTHTERERERERRRIVCLIVRVSAWNKQISLSVISRYFQKKIET
jgi:uncharacterized protein involved in tellurium resistance